MAGNFFDQFDANADLTKPQGGLNRPRTPAELAPPAAAPAAPAGGNFFDRYDNPTATPAKQTTAGEPEKGWAETIVGAPILNMVDRAGLALGLIDPATYKGRDPAAAAAAPSVSARRTDGLERAVDVGVDAFQRSPIGALVRSGATALGADDTAQVERERREQYDARAVDDPWRREGDTIGQSIERGATNLAGMFAGGLVGDPTNLLAPGGTFLSKVLGNAAIGVGSDVLTQGAEMGQGVRDKFDPVQTGATAAIGAALPGAMEGIPALRQWWKSRGVNVDTVPDEQLVAGSLDGTIGDTGLTPDQVDGILRGAGAGMEQFSTPEAGAAAAARVQQAQATAPANFEGLELGAGKSGARQFQDALAALNAAREQGAMPARVPGDDVTMIAAPEGTIRSDDMGGQAGLERKRAADSAVMGEGAARAADDPLLAAVLDSNVSPQMKVAAIARRLQDETPAPSIDTSVPGIAEGFRAPTPARAAETVSRAANPDRSRIHDITMATESNGKRYGADGQLLRSRAGAQGEMQVMPGTSRDPGFGVRAAQNDSPEELARVGRDYIDAMSRRYDGDMRKAWAAYNAGPGAVDGAIAKHGAEWLEHMPAETRGYVGKNMAALGGQEAPQTWRMSAPDNPEGLYSGRTQPNQGKTNQGETTLGDFENQAAATSPSMREMEQGVGAGEGPSGASGGSDRLFRSSAADAEWEARARATADELHAKAKEDLERRWQEREQARQEREANKGADERFQRERTRTEEASAGDPSAFYRGKYEQKPAKNGATWATTAEGYVAGKGGGPVAFRNAREAAKWAAGEKLGGDFEFVSWGGQDRTGAQRVALRRREGSTYGDPIAPAPAEPPAGRSPDTSQRVLSGPSAETPEVAPGAVARQGAADAPATPPASPAPRPADIAGADAVPRGAAGGDGRGDADLPVDAAAGRATDLGPGRDADPAPTARPVSGNAEQVVTSRGRAVDTEFEVREARDLLSSSDAGFDQRFQPRDRAGRSSSDAQIAEMASRLDPEQLHTSRQAAQGAPIVGPDRMVESGNGRVSSIRRAYELHPERAEAYRQMIRDRGFDTDGFEQPILVRRRTTEMGDDDRAAFVREANERDTMGMSSTEQAKVDAGTLPRDTLALYRGGAVSDAGNREFVRAWMDRVATPAERNSLMQGDGTLSADGVRRIRSSLLAKAFDDADLVAKVVEDPDTEIRAIGNTLTDAAPAFAQLRERVADGDLPAAYDITRQVAEAANKIATARNQGTKIGDSFRQDDMFGGRVDPVTEAVARMLFKDDAMTKPRSAADMAEGLRFYTDEAAKHSDTDMFGGGASAARAVDILDAAKKRLDAKRETKGATLFQRARDEGFASLRGEDRPLAGELSRIADETRNPAVAGLARELEQLVGDIEVRFGDLEPGVAGRVDMDGEGNLAVSVTGPQRTETILHEAVHVATMARWGELGEGAAMGEPAGAAIDALTKLHARAVRSFRGDGGTVGHALENVDEFLAYGLTSPTFQKWLQGRNEAGLWGRFVNGVRSILGLQPRYDTMLGKVLTTGADLLRAARGTEPTPPRGGGAPVTRFQREDTQRGPRSWGKVADLVFDPEFRGGDAAAANAAIRRTISDPKAAATTALDRLRGFGEAVAYSTDAAMRSMGSRFNAPTMSKLADLFHAEAGVTGKATERTFGEAVSRNTGRFGSQLNEALLPHRENSAAMGRIRDLLATPNKSVRATAAEREAAGKIRDLLAEVLEYRRDAGEAIGEVKDGYFPRMMRQDRVFQDPDGFLRAAEAAYRQIGADDPAKAAAAYLQRNIDGHLGIADGVGSGSPGASTAKAREFGKAADEHLRDFYDTDPLSALSTYLTGAVKRAEEVRRFGAKGREGSAARAAWEKEHGDRTQWDVMREQIQAELRANGQRQEGLMDRIEALRTNSLGRARMGSPRTGAAVSVIHAWNQLSTLGRSTVASIPELSMGFVRAGPRLGFTHMQETLSEFVRNVRRLPPSDAARYAEAAGAIGSDNTLHLLRARADDVTANTATSKLLDQFYRKNGLEAWTRAGRTAAVKTGQRFMDVLAGDMAGTGRTKARAAGYLRELGIKDPEAFAATLRAGAPKASDLAGDSGHAAEYATALLRFANQTVLMPTRSVKPSWASHPIGSLVFALQSYNYAFKKNVLDRVGRETVAGIKERDPAKLAAAAGLVALVGTTAAVQGIRHAVWGTPVSAEKQDGLHYTLETLDRSGMFGAASPIFNAFEGLKYRRSVGQSLQGSVLGRTSDGLDAIGGLATNNGDSNAAERKAAGAFYDLVVNPVESAIGAGVLRGAAGSAVILGHGTRNDNGLLPADRAMFVDGMAGKKPEPE